MDNRLLHEGSIGLKPGEVLRLRNAAGRHLAVLQGNAWVTQDGDARDSVVGCGESFRFDRDGLALVMPLGAETRLILEGGLAPEGREAPEYFSAHGEDMAYFERRAQRLRAEAFARAGAWLAGALKALWGRYARAQSGALQSLRAAHELRALGDRGLKDIGLRRDQIDCVTRQIPC
jgi:uncharacterized protein YjiS (DUF1127 family)